MTERMGLAAVGRQNRQWQHWHGGQSCARQRAGWRLWQWDLRAAGPLCTVH